MKYIVLERDYRRTLALIVLMISFYIDTCFLKISHTKVKILGKPI